jgi:hypothetical protein
MPGIKQTHGSLPSSKQLISLTSKTEKGITGWKHLLRQRDFQLFKDRAPVRGAGCIATLPGTALTAMRPASN